MTADQYRETLLLLGAAEMCADVPRDSLKRLAQWASDGRETILERLSDAESAKAVAGMRAKVRQIEREQTN